MIATRRIIALMLLTWSVGVMGQSKTETLNESFEFEKPEKKNVLYLANISGNMSVVGYDGSDVQVEVRKKIHAKSQGRLDEVFDDVQVGILDRMDTIFVYIEGVCGQFGKQSQKWSDEPNKWGYDWNQCQQSFDYTLDFNVKVPRNTNLYVSTINEGDVVVAGMSSSISAKNVNGSIEIREARDLRYAHTINGDVTINCDQLPTRESRYYSLNGDIQFNYPKNLSAELSFKSYNGDMFTNISELTYLPQQVEMKKAEQQQGIKYELEGKTLIKARNGGVRLDFETFNGDVYIKENIN